MPHETLTKLNGKSLEFKNKTMPFYTNIYFSLEQKGLLLYWVLVYIERLITVTK